MALVTAKRCPAPTTFSRMVALLALGAVAPSWAAEPVTEAELVRRVLDAPVATADLEAVDAQTRADRTAVSLFDSPALEARHEAARGDFGATTYALGASLTVDLGFSPLAHTRAGRLRGSAGDHRRAAVVLETVCGVRADAVELWAANRSASASQASQERLDRLLETLAALGEAGETSGYDRDRAALSVMAHQTSTAQRLGAAEGLRARVSALAGGEVVDVALAEVPDPPAIEASIAALASHPVLRALALERDAQQADRDGSRRDQLPDLMLSGGSRWDAGPTGGPATQGFEVGGAVQIPWMNGDRAAARQHTAAHAAAEARLARARAELEAEVRGAHRRVETLTFPSTLITAPEAVWTATIERYRAGEGSLDDLLQVADAVEAAGLAGVERERMWRRARLDLSCSSGQFADPNLQSVLEEAVR